MTEMSTIDKDAYLRLLQQELRAEVDIQACRGLARAIDLLDEMPLVYPDGSALESIRQKIERKAEIYSYSEDQYFHGKSCAYKDAADIVKGGTNDGRTKDVCEDDN